MGAGEVWRGAKPDEGSQFLEVYSGDAPDAQLAPSCFGSLLITRGKPARDQQGHSVAFVRGPIWVCFWDPFFETKMDQTNLRNNIFGA